MIKKPDFQIIKPIGAGGFGRVFMGKEIKTGKAVAIKRIDKSKLMKKSWREVNIMMGLNHPNLVYFLGFMKNEVGLYIVEEYCNGGNLSFFLKKGLLNERETAHVLRDICSGVFYLHKNNIIHRDLKPDNILVKYDESQNNGNKKNPIKFKICDFGIARHCAPPGQPMTNCGTASYKAPEVHLNQIYDKKADIWSIGAIACELMTGHTDINFAHYYNLSNTAMDFLKNTLANDPKKRFDIYQVCSHKFLTQNGHNGFESMNQGSFIQSVNQTLSLISSSSTDDSSKTLSETSDSSLLDSLFSYNSMSQSFNNNHNVNMIHTMNVGNNTQYNMSIPNFKIFNYGNMNHNTHLLKY